MWMKLFKAGIYGLAVKQVAGQVASVRHELRELRRRRRNRNLAAGIAGAAVGTTAGLLLAPQSGRKTREALAGRAGDTVGHLRHRVAEKAAHSHGEMAEKGRQAAAVRC